MPGDRGSCTGDAVAIVSAMLAKSSCLPFFLLLFSFHGSLLCQDPSIVVGNRQMLDAAAKAKNSRQPERGNASTAIQPQSNPASSTPAGNGGEPLFMPHEIARSLLLRDVVWLSDTAREGRMTGSSGARAAANWLADYFHTLGLDSFSGSYFQPFEFTAGTNIITGNNRIEITNSVESKKNGIFEMKDGLFKPLPFSASGEASGEILFAGFGLPTTGGNGETHNPYHGVDARNRIVLIYRDPPLESDLQHGGLSNQNTSLRYRAIIAREHGAKALLVVTAPSSADAGVSVPFNGAGPGSDLGILAASISPQVADSLPGIDKAVKEGMAASTGTDPGASESFILPNIRAHLVCSVIHVTNTDNNVIAYIPPAVRTEPQASARSTGSGNADISETRSAGGKQSPSPEYIMIGAHYDHLGRGPFGSLQRTGEENKIHPGADDNASGVAWVMELAAALAKDRREHPEWFQRGIIFACWSGEEIGMVGSTAFCDNPPVPLEQIAAYVNADMVGHLRDGNLHLEGMGSSTSWHSIIDHCPDKAWFKLDYQNEPFLPTDVNSFYPHGIPVLNLFTGWHTDYHRPTDTADKINFNGLCLITEFGRQVVLSLLQMPSRPQFTRIEKNALPVNPSELPPLYLGAMLDYTATSSGGAQVCGVREGSPAEKGGLQSGDLIISMGGQKVGGIADYTTELARWKRGAPVGIVVERTGETVQLTLTPE